MDWQIEVAVLICGLVWSVVKTSSWYKELASERYAEAIIAIEEGVRHAYRTLVAEYKERGEKLTPQTSAEARRLAFEFAKAFGAKRGIDITREIGKEFIEHYIESAVEDGKQSGIFKSGAVAGPVPVVAPKASKKKEVGQ